MPIFVSLYIGRWARWNESLALATRRRPVSCKLGGNILLVRERMADREAIEIFAQTGHQPQRSKPFVAEAADEKWSHRSLLVLFSHG